MLELIIKLVELIINLIELFSLSKNKNSKTIIIFPKSSKEEKNINMTISVNSTNLDNSSNSEQSILIWCILALIIATLSTFFYQVISITLFVITLLFTILKFKVLHKFVFPSFSKHALNYRGVLYSTMALSTYLIPSFLCELQSKLPAPSGLEHHFSNLLNWILNSTIIFSKQLYALDNENKFFILLCILFRFYFLKTLFKDVLSLLSKKRLYVWINKRENDKVQEATFLTFLSIITFIAIIFEFIREPILVPIINYFS